MISVKDYIENEIYYIEKDIEEEINNYNIEGLKEDKQFLESLTEEDINKIQEKVDTDSELSNDIDNLVNEAIHFWLYHYKKEK